MGGEKRFIESQSAIGKGSPPHGRGKVHWNELYNGSHGITPAWAGKSIIYFRVIFIPEDHPRMGGEKKYPFPPRFVG